MSMGAILGLIALNLWFGLVGVAVIFGLRGWTTWLELGRALGVAYMAGVAAMGVAMTWQLTVGIDLSVASILGLGALLMAVAVVCGFLLGHRLPSWPTHSRMSGSASIAAGFFAALTVVYLEAQFRAGRLAGLYEFDAWSFWVPKAKAIYFFGGLDRQLFHDLPGPSYPPLVPVLQAAGFHFMGRPDEVTLHLQFAFLLFGFVAALTSLVGGRVPPLLFWPPLLLVLVAPQVVGHALQPEGDFLLDEMFALAAVALALWLLDREPSFLRLTALFLGAAVLTKREGVALAACVLIAMLVATLREARFAWPRLAAVGLLTAATLVPWRVFLLVRDLPGGGPEAGGLGLFSNLDRAWPSLRLALSTLFDFHVWLIVIPLLVLAIVAASAVGPRELVTYASVLCVLCVAAFTWSTWAFPSLPITRASALNPIDRFSGALVLAAAGLIPLLLARAQESTWQRA